MSTGYGEYVKRHRLAARRRAMGFSQESLAEALTRHSPDCRKPVATSTVAGWEQGTTLRVRARWRRPLAIELDVSLDELDELLVLEDDRTSGPAPPSIENDTHAFASPLRATLDDVDELGRADMDRRTLLKNALFMVGASIAPSRDWLLATLDEATAPTRRVGTGQVDAIRRTFGLFQELDVTRGGGYARQQLAAYLTSTVVPLLRTNDSSTQTGRELYEAGAEQLYLIGWMAFDDGEHVLAQRYLHNALRLAREARRPELGAHVLAGLSDQATLTGHPQDGLQLARAGRLGLQRGHSPACLADLWALQARAEAMLGDHRAVAHSVMQSQQSAEAGNGADEPEWARFIPGAYLYGEYAHAFRDLDRPTEAATFASLSAEDAARQSRARRGSLAHATIARAALASHDLDAAAASATTTVELAAKVRSSRSVDAVADLRARLAVHDRSPAVADFLAVADALLPL
jgi:transcriptional regulator with XRE-family HTH domain